MERGLGDHSVWHLAMLKENAVTTCRRRPICDTSYIPSPVAPTITPSWSPPLAVVVRPDPTAHEQRRSKRPAGTRRSWNPGKTRARDRDRERERDREKRGRAQAYLTRRIPQRRKAGKESRRRRHSVRRAASGETYRGQRRASRDIKES